MGDIALPEREPGVMAVRVTDEITGLTVEMVGDPDQVAYIIGILREVEPRRYNPETDSPMAGSGWHYVPPNTARERPRRIGWRQGGRA